MSKTPTVDDYRKALRPITSRVRTDITAVKTPDGSRWTHDPLTDDALVRHLSNNPARGVCPIKAGESTTKLALLDFDSHRGETDWAGMVLAAERVMDALSSDGYAPIAFRSSGGKGMHVYVLWDTPQDARSVRQMLLAVLERLGFKNGTGGVGAGQIEVFPKQDSVPIDGYGSQFILPLAGKSEPLDLLFGLEPMGRDYILTMEWPTSPSVPVVAALERSVAGLSENAEPIDRVRSALMSIPNTDEAARAYDPWFRIVCAVHEATGGSEEGRELCIEWSRQASKFDLKFFNDRVWGCMRPAQTRGSAITRATLFKEAYSNGWVEPTSAAGFGEEDTPSVVPAPDCSKKPFSLSDFALNGTSQHLRTKMLDDKFILGRLAILGQATVFYAPPNTGKTLLVLWLLVEAIKAGDIRGEDVYYINADDSFKGVVVKLELAEQNGFHMLVPGHNGFVAREFLTHLRTLVAQGNARGKVVILDTLKKFTDVMDKKVSSGFATAIREFVSNGGSVVMLAHVNKKRNEDGKVIHGGTSDIPDDVDCYFTIDKLKDENDTHTVIFENGKNRGDVAQTASYSYTRLEGQDYMALFNTVRSLTDEDTKKAYRQREVAARLEKNGIVISSILNVLASGVDLKTDLITAVHKECGTAKSKVMAVLDEHTGCVYTDGHRWGLRPGEKNAKHYVVLPVPGS